MQQKSALKMLQLLGCFREDRLTWPVGRRRGESDGEKESLCEKTHMETANSTCSVCTRFLQPEGHKEHTHTHILGPHT